MATDKQELEQEPSPNAGRVIPQEEQDFIRLAIKRHKAAQDFTSDNRKQAIQHNEFIIEGKQWSEAAVDARKNRVMLTNNHAPEAIDRIVGEIRQNPPRGKARAVDSVTDPKLADVITALGKYIERNSRAARMYAKVAEYPITNSYSGFMRVITDYASDDTWEQEIYFLPIMHQFSVSLDPGMTRFAEPGKGGAKWGMIEEVISRAEFAERFPKATLIDFEKATGDEEQNWWMKENVRIAEYYVARPKEVELVELKPKLVVEKDSERHKKIMAFQPRLKELRSRKVTRWEIEHFLISGLEKLTEAEKWSGKYIPIVPVEAKNFWHNGKKINRGVFTWAMDSNRIENYTWSQIVETLALAPKGKWVGTAAMFEDNLKEWENANQSTTAALTYKPDPTAQQTRPEFTQPPAIQPGHVNVLQIAVDQRKSIQGVYDASLGGQSNETSGRAINARDSQMQASHFAFVDNLAEAIEFLWMIALDLIPHIYDTERILRVYGEDGRHKEDLAINQDTGKVQMDPETGESVAVLLNDVRVFRCDVDIDVGPSLKSQRMETADALTRIMQVAPAVAVAGSHLLARSLDFQYADELADNLEALLPPEIKALKEKKQGGQDAAVQDMIKQIKQQSMQAFQVAEQKIMMLEQEKAILMQKVQQSVEAMNNKAREIEIKDKEIDAKVKIAEIQAQAQAQTAPAEKEIADLQQQIHALSNLMEGMQKFHDRMMEYGEGKKEKGNGKEGLTVIVDNKSGKVTKTVSLKTPEGKEYTGEVTEEAQ